MKSFASLLSLNEDTMRRKRDSQLGVIDDVVHIVYIDEPEKTCSAMSD
jgi:hypothetical protein